MIYMEMTRTMKKTRAVPKKKKIMPAIRKTTFFPIVGIGASAGGALKGNLAKAGELLEDITSELRKHGEFVSKPDWIDTAKRQARITDSKIYFTNPNSAVKTMGSGFFVAG
jgi:hypothetical protein